MTCFVRFRLGLERASVLFYRHYFWKRCMEFRGSHFVVSPLRSLMKNQCDSLNGRGIRAACILPASEMCTEVKIGILNGKYSILFCSPESVTQEPWTSMLRSRVYRQRLCLVALDEAHCITEWGDTFRPAYKEISILKSILQVPFLVLTATATEKLKKDVLLCLDIDPNNVKTVAVVPDRPNIFLKIMEGKVWNVEDLVWIVDELLEDDKSPKTIIYCRTIGAASNVYEFLMSYLLPAQRSEMVEMYHSAMHRDDETRILQNFPKPESCIRVLVSTVAFGMGVSIPDVRQIVHWGVSKSILSYWQEVGRAGRDGMPATACVYPLASSLQERQGTSVDMVDVFRDKMKDGQCLRAVILGHLMLNDMKSSVKSVHSSCTLSCEICACHMCTCCTQCRNQCPCSK